MTDGPFGVELPENFESAPAEAPQSQETNQQVQTTNEEKIQEILDLDKVPKFRLDGKELTAKELRDERMMRSDYTRKTQEIAETRKELEQKQKYADNFHIDAMLVIKKPELMNSFSGIYPKQYVETLKLMMGQVGAKEVTGQSQQTTELPEEVTRRLASVEERFEAMDKQAKEVETRAAEAELDRIFDPLTKKYPFADEQAVTARAQMIAERAKQEGQSLDINNAFFEKLFQEQHERNLKAYEQITKQKITEQKQAASLAKDLGRGGDVQGAPAKQMRSMKEAREAMLNDFGG
jgi:hypothetical protein